MNDSALDLVKVYLDLPNHWWFKGESVWARPLGNELYAIENIPFCAYGLNCGDVVRATADAPELKPRVRELVSSSGNRTLRVSFCDELPPDQQQPRIESIEALGAWVERANPQFICINIPPDRDYEAVRALLGDWEEAGELVYETCEARVEGSFDDAPGEETDNEA